MTEHTPTPWRVFTNDDGTKLVGIGNREGQGILDCGFGVWAWDDAEGIANANLVVKAVNSYDEIERLRADAARYQYLKTCCSYFYHESHNPPSPREFGIEWHWQDGTPERPDIDTLIDREIEEKRALYALDEDESSVVALKDHQP